MPRGSFLFSDVVLQPGEEVFAGIVSQREKSRMDVLGAGMLLHIDELKVEDEHGVRGNVTIGILTIAERGRNEQRAFTAFLEIRNAFLPAFDHGVKRKGRAGRRALIEKSAVGKKAIVFHRHLRVGVRLRACSLRLDDVIKPVAGFGGT